MCVFVVCMHGFYVYLCLSTSWRVCVSAVVRAYVCAHVCTLTFPKAYGDCGIHATCLPPPVTVKILDTAHFFGVTYAGGVYVRIDIFFSTRIVTCVCMYMRMCVSKHAYFFLFVYSVSMSRFYV